MGQAPLAGPLKLPDLHFNAGGHGIDGVIISGRLVATATIMARLINIINSECFRTLKSLDPLEPPVVDRP